jgi:hypothetical protein
MDILLIAQVIRTHGYEVIRNIQTKEYFVFDPIRYTIIPLHIYINNLHQNYVLYYNHYINQQIYNQQIYNQFYDQQIYNPPTSPNNQKYIHPNSPKNKVKFTNSQQSPTSPTTTPKLSWNCF